MKQFFKMFFASLLAMIVSAVVLVGLVIAAIIGVATKISSSTTEQSVLVKDKSVLVIDLDKSVHEQGEDYSIPFFGNENSSSAGLYEVIRSLKAAQTDSKIEGVLIKLAPSPNNWATLQQVRQAIKAFKQSGKFVYAYGETITQGAFYVASAADSIFVNPAGDVELKGLSTSLTFFKNTLEKLEVEPEIFYAGKFKSATEPFRADKISEPNRLQLSAVQSGLWQQLLTAIAEHNKADTASINLLAQSGTIQFPQDALAHGLVDGIRYWDQVEGIMHKKLSVEEKKDINYISMDDYASSGILSSKTKDERIAVVFAEGQIYDGSSSGDYQITSEDMVKTLAGLRNNDKVKAVVLRVNSPGGSARASEVILRELQLLKQKKPVIVSMGDVAASGGYYIACAADSIFAMPNTITGSIGVFSMMFNSSKLLTNKLGISFDVVKNAPYADFPNAMRTMTAEERTMMQRGVDTIYALFKRHVATGRRLTEADVDSIAQGRIWTGTDAMRIGLVDGMGNLDRAIASAAAKANLRNYQVSTYPERVDKIKSLMKKIKDNTSISASIQTAMKQEFGSAYDAMLQLKGLQQMNGRSMMLLPFVFSTQ